MTANLDHARVAAHDLAAERMVIGCFMLDRDCASSLSAMLKPSDFYRDGHGFIWEALLACEAAGMAADTVEVRERLKAAGKLARVGGDEYLIDLHTGAIPTLANAEAWAKRIADLACVRAMGKAAASVYAESFEVEDAGDYLARAERAIANVALERRSEREMVTLGDASLEAYARMTARAKGDLSAGAPIPTGLALLDHHLGGGFWPGQLVIIAARPGCGKTALALRCAREAGKRAPCAFFSLEMPADAIGARALSTDARVDGNKLRTLSLSRDDMEAMQTSRAMHDATVWIDDTPGTPHQEVRRKAIRLLRRHGTLSMVVVDYLQLMRSAVRGRSREEEVSESSRMLKELAKELRVPVVALSQMNRDYEKRGKGARPQLSDLRESGALEQDADTVLFIHREEMADAANEAAKGKAEIIIGKQREGMTGKCEVAFVKHLTAFENLEVYR